MQKEKWLQSLFCVLFLTAYLFAGSKPNWIENRPVNDAYYIGIGYAQKDPGLGNYHQIARDNALKDLASEITVHISSSFIHTIAEQAGMIAEDVQSYVRSTTQANLEGYELVDKWEDDQEYWVYYRLSKAKYRSAKQQKLDKAASMGLDLFRKGKANEAEGKYANALIYYIQAFNPIQEYLGEPLQVEYDGSQIYLMNSIYSSIQDLLANLELQALQPNRKVKVGQALKKPLRVKAVYNGSKPVSGLPLHFEFIRGKGSLIRQAITDRNGVGSSRVSKISATDRIQIIRVRPDLSSSLGSGASKLVQNIVNHFSVPTTKFVLDVSGLTAYLDVTERPIEGAASVLYIEPKLKNALTGYGFAFTTNVAKADVMIKLNAAARKGAVMHDLYVAWVDMNLSIMDMSSGKEIYKNSFANIKGINLDYEKATVKAFENAAKKVEEVLPAVIAQIQK
ncbi:MAG TPA: hypothetical protein ENK44_08080 [Caldithrix abyssi]|uniref:LPP20 lipoprotein n=1 Tax=Caldithrix abyssi TaxID=187145 RepID=A0A7V4UDK2_CALAY|nr:hypothetical protein [Caldithrix abyssi]